MDVMSDLASEKDTAKVIVGDVSDGKRRLNAAKGPKPKKSKATAPDDEDESELEWSHYLLDDGCLNNLFKDYNLNPNITFHDLLRGLPFCNSWP